MAPPVDILTDSSLLLFPSESEEKYAIQPKKVIFASTDIRYRDTEEEYSGVPKVESSTRNRKLK